MTLHFSRGAAIAAGEASSSVASLGAVWLMGKHEHFIQPARDFVARKLVLPLMKPDANLPAPTEAVPDPRLDAARKKAELLFKGLVMITSGFATHVGVQMTLEGRCDRKEFQEVVTGKAMGLVLTAVAGGLIGEKGRNWIERAVGHCSSLPACKLTHANDDKAAPNDMCKLIAVEIPSSILSGLTNYLATRGRTH